MNRPYGAIAETLLATLYVVSFEQVSRGSYVCILALYVLKNYRFKKMIIYFSLLL